MRYSTDKDIQKDVARLVRIGWHFIRGGKHGKLVPPEGGTFLTVPCSPGDRHSFKCFRRDIDRYYRRRSSVEKPDCRSTQSSKAQGGQKRGQTNHPRGVAAEIVAPHAHHHPGLQGQAPPGSPSRPHSLATGRIIQDL